MKLMLVKCPVFRYHGYEYGHYIFFRRRRLYLSISLWALLRYKLWLEEFQYEDFAGVTHDTKMRIRWLKNCL